MLRTTHADAATTRPAAIWGCLVGAAFLAVGFLLGELLGLKGAIRIWFALATGVVVAWFVRRLAVTISDWAGRSLLSFVQPSGRSSPYEPEFSQAQALAAAGKATEALALYETEMRRLPANEVVRIQAAEFFVRQSQPRRAESLFLEVRRMTSDRGRELYATQRIIDLRLGVLDETGRALPELRRLIDRFPNSPEADDARQALARLKREGRDDLDGWREASPEGDARS